MHVLDEGGDGDGALVVAARDAVAGEAGLWWCVRGGDMCVF